MISPAIIPRKRPGLLELALGLGRLDRVLSEVNEGESVEVGSGSRLKNVGSGVARGCVLVTSEGRTNSIDITLGYYC